MTQFEGVFEAVVIAVPPRNDWLPNSLASSLLEGVEEPVAPSEPGNEPEDLLKSLLLYPAGVLVV